jgi:hypothetical protein
MFRKLKITLLSLVSVLLFKHIGADNQQVIQISIPKCGTHLLSKVVQLLTDSKSTHWTPITNEPFDDTKYFYISTNALYALTHLPAGEHYITHLFYDEDHAHYLDNKDFRIFFLYRDPRDQSVSSAFFLQKIMPVFAKIPFDDFLLSIIDGQFNEGRNVGKLYAEYEEWLKFPNILTIRFEDLVGSKGGGSDETQMLTIKKIAQHLGISVSETKINDVISQLFGNTYTFREGKIGSWQKYFKKTHIDAFKQYGSETLIKWGYEKDNNW